MLRYMVIRIPIAVLLNSLDTCCVVWGRDLYWTVHAADAKHATEDENLHCGLLSYGTIFSWFLHLRNLLPQSSR
jgi:hypothetical protein